jgi:hypothetical protein
MASSGNFATMNPLHKTSNSVVYSQGNLKTSPSSNWSSTTWCFSNIVIPKDKKIYVEARLSAGAGVYASLDAATNLSTPGTSEVGSDGSVSLYNESKYVNGTRSASWITAASAGDILQLAIDGSNNKVWLGYNNTWGGSGNPSAGSNEAGTINTSTALGYDIFIACTQNSVSTMTFNFGQDSTFGGEVSAGGNADANGFGDFKYAPPTNFLALCTGNLSVSADIDPAQTDDEYSGKNFNTVLFDGNGTTNAVTGLGFKPDLIWGFTRSGAQSKRVVDSTRGGSERLYSDSTIAASTGTATISEFGTDGFTSTGGAFNNDSGKTCGAWCWKANGGVTSSNSEGSITATVQANTKAGFSIATYTSPGSGTNHTVGHGLSDVDFVITKNRSATFNWYCFHKSVPDKTFRLNSNATGFSYANWSMGSTTWGSENGYTHDGTSNFVAYAWQNVEGFQKFGTYVGNNTDNNGPFVYTGFRPRLLVIKGVDEAYSWFVFDSARNPHNLVDKHLRWNGADAEAAEPTGARKVDFLSNGFKVMADEASLNGSGDTYMYMAWGDVPFKYNNTF